MTRGTGSSRRIAWVAASLTACAVLAACGPRASAPALAPAGIGANARDASWEAAAPTGLGAIQHVVVIVQENRSFDDLFQGFPGANTVSSGLNSKGQTIPLQPIPLEAPWNIDHEAKEFFQACDGAPRGRNCKMDGFDKETTFGTHPPANLQYAYVPHSETKPYFDIAKQYVLADNMFPSQLDESFESHQYIIAAQANRAVDGPVGEYGCGDPSAMVLTLLRDRHYGPRESPCFTTPTIGSELDAKALPWRYYAANPSDLGALWSAYRASSYVFNGPDWTADVINPSAVVLKDIGKGHLAAVTWVTPTCKTSDHASCLSNEGPDWVASVVNAVGESKFWNSTAIFIMWDEWGGWYDHVPPPYLDYDGSGIRVPLMVVSAYAKKHYVSHVQYEHGSILKFIEDTFGLARLARSDTRANSPAGDCFDFSAPPRQFVPIPTTLKPEHFIDAPPDPRPPQPGID
jgi:phospholipase C